MNYRYSPNHWALFVVGATTMCRSASMSGGDLIEFVWDGRADTGAKRMRRRRSSPIRIDE